MIDYELAKELKDAGFPQPSMYGIPVYGPEIDDPYRPTLSELIEACHLRQIIKPDTSVLGVNQKGFETHEVFPAVAMNEYGWIAWDNHYLDPDEYFQGSTPEEAVARLWLALNKK